MPTSEPDKRLRAELAAELGWYPVDLDDEFNVSKARQLGLTPFGGHRVRRLVPSE